MNAYTSTTWRKVKLGDLLDLVIDYRGKTPKKLGGDWSEKGIPALSAKNIKNGKIVNEDAIKYIELNLYDRWMKDRLREGDILLTSEAPLGELFYLREEHGYCLSQRLFGLRTKSDILNPRFLYYYLMSRAGQSELNARSTGTTVQGIRQKELLKVSVSYPANILEQERISASLAAYDDLIGVNEKKIRTLEEIAQAVYREWFVHFRFPGHEKSEFVDSPLGKIPKGWEVKKLGDLLADVIGGGTPSKDKPEYWGGSIPWASVKDMTDGVYSLADTEDHITGFGLSNSASHLISAGSLIISTRMGLGRCFINQVDMAINQDLKALIPKEGINTHLLLRLLISQTKKLKSMGTGSTVMGIRVEDLKSLLVCVPNFEIQTQGSLVLTFCDDLVSHLRLENINLRQTRDLLLPKLMSGEIIV